MTFSMSLKKSNGRKGLFRKNIKNKMEKELSACLDMSSWCLNACLTIHVPKTKRHRPIRIRRTDSHPLAVSSQLPNCHKANRPQWFSRGNKSEKQEFNWNRLNYNQSNFKLSFKKKKSSFISSFSQVWFYLFFFISKNKMFHLCKNNPRKLIE